MKTDIDNNPYESPEANLDPEQEKARSSNKFWAINGRLGRTSYFCYAMFAPLVNLVVLSAVGVVLYTINAHSILE